MIFTSSDKTNIHYNSFCKENNKASLLVLHGLGEHPGRYEEFRKKAEQENLDIHLMSLRGHGCSEGTRGHVDNFSQYHEDISAWYSCLKEQGHLRSPIFLFGHSLGGLIFLDYILHSRQPLTYNVSGIALSSPALGINTPLKVIKPFLDTGAFGFLERLQFPNSIKPKYLSHDKKYLRNYKEDPLIHNKITLALFRHLLGAIHKVWKTKSKINVPILFFIAGEDKIVDSQAILSFAKSSVVENKKIEKLPGFYHEVFQEKGKAKVYSTFFKWINQCLKKKEKN